MYCWLTNMFYPAIKTLKVKPFKKITLIMRKNCNMHHTVEWISVELLSIIEITKSCE